MCITLMSVRRFPLPGWFYFPMVLKLGSWFALLLEFSLGGLIWVKEFRYPLLALGVLFHLFLEYSLNIPLFQWDVLSAYVLFIDPKNLERVRNWKSLHLSTGGLAQPLRSLHCAWRVAMSGRVIEAGNRNGVPHSLS
jgi:hypothetical protein